MQALVLAVLIGLLGGIAVSVQNPLVSVMGQRMGIMESAFVTHFGGTIVAGVVLLAMGGGQLHAWRTVPWYALGAGVFGVTLISSLAFTIPRLGVAAAVVLVVAAQLAVSASIDHFGLLHTVVRPMDPWKLVGIALLMLGAWLVVRR